MSPRHRVGALALAVTIAACGVSADGDPQVIATEDVPFSLLDPDLSTSTTETASATTQSTPFFLIRTTTDGNFLVRVDRDTPASPTPGDIITTLLDLQPSEDDPLESDLKTTIPEGTTLLNADLDSSRSLLTLDFSENLLTVIGDAQTGLFAQIVCTATEIDGVDSVSFQIDGEPVDVRTDDSQLTPDPVDCRDYQSFRAGGSGN